MSPDDLTTKSFALGCPVPTEQQPLNEFLELKESGFFQWGLLELWPYVRRLLWLWGWGWAIAGPVAAASFSPSRYPVQFVILGAVGATFLPVLNLVRLYLGWNYINSRLSSPTVFYEESGWYDGQSWTKPPQALTQDRLIVTYQVQPVLKRIRQTLVALVLALMGGCVAWLML